MTQSLNVKALKRKRDEDFDRDVASLLESRRRESCLDQAIEVDYFEPKLFR